MNVSNETFANSTSHFDRNGILQVAFYCILVPVSLVGNVLTMCVSVKSVRRAKVSRIPDVLIGCLALNDLLSVLCIHSFTIVSMIAGYWILGDIGCQYMSFMSYSYFKFGFWCVLAIAIDRSYRLVKPLRYPLVATSKKLKIAISVIVVFSLGSSLINPVFDPGTAILLKTWYVCFPDWEEGNLVQLIVVIGITSFFVPGVIGFVICYILNAVMLYRIQKNSARMRTPVANTSDSTDLRKKTTLAMFFKRNKIPMRRNLGSESSTPELTRNTSEGTLAIKKRIPILKTHRSSPDIRSSPVRSANECQTTASSSCQAASVNLASGSDVNTCEESPNLSTTRRLANCDSQQVLQESYISQLERNRTKTEKKRETAAALGFAKLSLVIATVFAVLWIPYAATIILGVGGVFVAEQNPLAQDIVIKCVFFNAASNPVLYGVFNKHYRDGYIYFVRLAVYYLLMKRLKRPTDPLSRKRYNLTGILSKMTDTMRTAEAITNILPSSSGDMANEPSPRGETGSDLEAGNESESSNGACENVVETPATITDTSVNSANDNYVTRGIVVENRGCINVGFLVLPVIDNSRLKTVIRFEEDESRVIQMGVLELPAVKFTNANLGESKEYDIPCDSIKSSIYNNSNEVGMSRSTVYHCLRKSDKGSHCEDSTCL